MLAGGAEVLFLPLRIKSAEDLARRGKIFLLFCRRVGSGGFFLRLMQFIPRGKGFITHFRQSLFEIRDFFFGDDIRLICTGLNTSKQLRLLLLQLLKQVAFVFTF